MRACAEIIPPYPHPMKYAGMAETIPPHPHTISYAGMAELADALDSGSSRGNSVEVQVLLPAPKTEKESQSGSFSVFDTSKG